MCFNMPTATAPNTRAQFRLALHPVFLAESYVVSIMLATIWLSGFENHATCFYFKKFFFLLCLCLFDDIAMSGYQKPLKVLLKSISLPLCQQHDIRLIISRSMPFYSDISLSHTAFVAVMTFFIHDAFHQNSNITNPVSTNIMI